MVLDMICSILFIIAINYIFRYIYTRTIFLMVNGFVYSSYTTLSELLVSL